MSFLVPLIHLYLNFITRIEVDGKEIIIQKKSRQHLWKISTPIFEGRGEFPKETQECLELIQNLKWKNEGMLEIDSITGTIHWTKELNPSDFGKEFPRFLKHAAEWAEVIATNLFSLKGSHRG